MAISGITKLRKTGTQNIATGAWRIVTWDEENYDNLGAFDSGTSTSNIVIPTGITLMRAALFAGWANSSSGNRYLNLTKSDGSVSYLLDIRSAINESFSSSCSGWVSVTAGDTIRLEANSGSATLNIGGTFGTYPNLTLEWATGFAALHG